jgi:hypothetical protein
MQIHVYRNGVEQGPFDEDTVTRMLADGRLMPFDRAWYAGLAGWLPLSQLLPLRREDFEPTDQDDLTTETRPPLPDLENEPASATPKQKAFLSYLGISFRAAITREEAAALVTAAMENPAEKARIARWNDERLRLHPDIFAAEVRAWKENRPARFHELVRTEGADAFQDVSEAHCQVLVKFLDVKYPNWDARGHDAIWSYFFPAIAEKFPQLVRKAWRGRLHFPDGPKVAIEITHDVAPLPALRSSPHFAMRAVALLMLLTALASAGYYVWENPHVILRWRKPAASRIEAAQPTAPSVPEPIASGPTADPQPPPARAVQVEKPAATPTLRPTAVAVLATPRPALPKPAPAPEPIATAPAPAATPYPFQGTSPPSGIAFNPAFPRAVVRKDVVTVLKPLDVTLKFGRIRIPPGTTLKVVRQDGPIVNVVYMNSTVAIPVSATDWQ